MRAGLLTLALLVGAPAGAVTTADHRGEVQGELLTWTSSYAVGTGERTVRLAHPVSAEVVEAGGVTVRHDSEGRIEALDWDAPRGQVTVALRQPLDDPALQAPLADEGLQRIVLRGAHYSPEEAVGLTRHVGHWQSPGVTRRERKGLDRRYDGVLRMRRGEKLYVLPDTALRTHGLRGELRDRASVAWHLPLAAGGLAVGVLVLLGVAYRWLDARARVERVDAYMRDEFVRAEVNGSGPTEGPAPSTASG